MSAPAAAANHSPLNSDRRNRQLRSKRSGSCRKAKCSRSLFFLYYVLIQIVILILLNQKVFIKQLKLIFSVEKNCCGLSLHVGTFFRQCLYTPRLQVMTDSEGICSPLYHHLLLFLLFRESNIRCHTQSITNCSKRYSATVPTKGSYHSETIAVVQTI